MIIGPFDRVVIKPHNVGNSIEEKYHLERDRNGNSIYIKYDELDVRSFIQSFTAGCSLRDLLERCSLMPSYETLRHVNQVDDGISMDLSVLPKDATEAFIMLKKVSKDFPDVLDRVSKGETLESVFKSFATENQSIKNTTESEDINNGT